MNYSATCLVDNTVFYSQTKGEEKRKVGRYVKKKFGISYEQYILKYFHDNIVPKCDCSCGEKVSFHKGRYLKYFKDHKNHVKISEKTKEKIRVSSLIKNKDLTKRLNRLGVTFEQIKESYEDYVSFKKSRDQIIDDLFIDFRTLQKYWNEFKFIKDKEVFRRTTKKHQLYWVNKNGKQGGSKFSKTEDEMLEIFLYLQKNKSKTTIKELVNLFDVKIGAYAFYKRLVKQFEKEEIDDYLLSGNSSKQEVEYMNILKFFFGKDVKTQFRLEKKIYDFIINGVLLVEYDGEYWHSLEKNIINDRIKDKIAIDAGYKIFRVKESRAKDIEMLYKIQKLAYEN